MAFFCIHCRSEIDSTYKACPFCGEPITEFLRRHLETPIDGKYQILSCLGVGGMGEVYKVLHVHLNAIRVIKLMRSNIASDPGAHERFLREARLATRINHPNVAQLFDFSTIDDGAHYMVWEHIEGTNLHQVIDTRGPLSPRYAAKLAAQTLRGLDAIHRAGIIHRDISPENLMVTRDHAGDDIGDERVKIIDLGIAKQTGDEGEAKTKTGMFVGKWKYCSPEQLGMLGEGERIDGRADLYSFGIVLYEMLTGVPPFQADTPHAYLMLHAHERPKPIRVANPSVPAAPELEALIFRALDKDRAKRFATAREFAQALEQLIPTLPETPGAPTTLPSAIEVTAEPTRVTPAEPTRVTPAPYAETVLTRVVDSSGAADASPGEPSTPAGRGRPPLHWVLLVIALVAAIAALMWPRREPAKPVADTVADKPIVAAVAPAVPAAQGRLAINAFPWANVTSIRNADDGNEVGLTNVPVTPTALELAPGRYEVTLANPNYAKPITRTVEVDARGDATLFVQFTNTATLPDFGVVR